MTRQRALAAATIALALFVTACSDDGASVPDATGDDETSVAEPPVPSDAGESIADVATTVDSSGGSADAGGSSDAGGSTDVVAGEAFPDARCEANRAAGTITYLTGFDFAAAASILEVVVADERGYFDELCLDVELVAGDSFANRQLIAANEAQFASVGSFAEMVDFTEQNDADLVALSVDGHVAIEVLMVKPDMAASLDDLAGQEIGIKTALPPVVAVMLQQEAGLVEGDDYSTVGLEGFDPIAHFEIPGLAAVPGWRSNEPGALERAGVPFDLYDPSDYDIPGSFGVIYSSRQFVDDHPTVAEDFMRATTKALLESIDDTSTAAKMAVDRINGNGNPMFLSPEGETFRWQTDAAAIVSSTPEGSNVGVPVAEEMQAQLDAYAGVGYFGDGRAPSADGRYDPDLVSGVYAADGTVVWPG